MRKLYFILYLLCGQSLFAQKLNLFIGPEIKIDKEMNFFGHLHHDASGHYVMLTESSGKYFYERKKLTPIIQKYDHKFKLLFSRELVVDIENIAFENCFYAKNKFLLCTQKIETREKTLTLHATSISMKGDASKPQRLTQIQWNEKNDKPNNVNWAMSQDTTKLLVATYADADDKELRTKISITVQSSDLEKLWGRGFTLPYSQEQFSFENLTLGNNGKVYLLAKIYDDNNNKESKKENGKFVPAFRMIIFQFDPNSDKPSEVRLDLGEKYITDLTFKLDAKGGDLNCAGFYSNDRKGIVQGVFSALINGQTGKAMTANLKEFSAEDIALFDTDSDKSGDEGIAKAFEFNQIILRDDGGIVVTAEEAYSFVSSYQSRYSTVWQTTYVNNEICVTSINPQGEIEWVNTIPKKQIISETQLFSSYTMMVSGSKMYFLYNDHEDNLKNTLDTKAKRISTFKDAVATVVTINADGKMTRDQAFDVKDDTGRGLIVAKQCRQIGSDEMFFITTRYQLLGKPRLIMGTLKEVL